MAATAQQPPNAFAHRGAGGALLRSFVARTRPVTESVQLAMLHTRALDELAEHLEARCAADTAELRRLTAPSHKRAPPGGHPPRTGGAAGAALMSRIAAASACAVDVADAKVQVLDAAGVQVDTAIRDLDRRARLLETLLQEQGVAAGDAAVAAAAAAAAAKPGGRARRGAAGGESVDGDGGVGESAVAAGAGGRRSTALDVRAQVEQRVAAAASQSLTDALEHDPGSLLHEPVYCSCRQFAFGLMVECDNDACPVGWYHASCVGLGRDVPAGSKWVCPRCQRAAAGATPGAAAAPPRPDSHSAGPGEKRPRQ